MCPCNRLGRGGWGLARTPWYLSRRHPRARLHGRAHPRLGPCHRRSSRYPMTKVSSTHILRASVLTEVFGRKPVCRSGERGALPPGSRGIQTVERRVAADESWLGIPCLNPHRHIFPTRSQSIRPEWKSVGISGGCVGIVHYGCGCLCEDGCERADISRENAEEAF